jgi:hypothetical protein
MNERKITALFEINGRGKISPYLNIIPREGPEDLIEKISSAVEFPLKKKITKLNRISNKNISCYSLNREDASTRGIYK